MPVLEAGKEVEYLYWVGCSASYDRRNQAIARSVVAILKRAGVSFAVMAEERCHAEVGRRLGEEYLYQTLQAENVEAMKQYSFRRSSRTARTASTRSGTSSRSSAGPTRCSTTRRSSRS